MIRHNPVARAATSPLISWPDWLAMIATVLLTAAACDSGGSSNDPTKITGTFEVTSIDCNGLAAGVPADLTARIVSGRTYSFAFNGDGNTLTIEMVDPSCTWGGQYGVTYLSDTRINLIGFGSFACAPSAAACASILAVENTGDPNLCGKAINEAATLDHGSIPQSAGGTMTLSMVGDTACSENGGTNPLRFVLARQ